MSLLFALLLSLIVGAFARLLMPGSQKMAWWQTMFLGLAGCVVGSAIASTFGGSGGFGFISGILGAVLLLVAWGWARKNGILVILVFATVAMSGCATTRPDTKPRPMPEVEFGKAEEKLDDLSKTIEDARAKGLSVEETMRLVLEKAKELEKLNNE